MQPGNLHRPAGLGYNLPQYAVPPSPNTRKVRLELVVTDRVRTIQRDFWLARKYLRKRCGRCSQDDSPLNKRYPRSFFKKVTKSEGQETEESGPGQRGTPCDRQQRDRRTAGELVLNEKGRPTSKR